MIPEYLPKVGQLVHTEEPRDAIHIAIIPVTLGEDLDPSCFVLINENGEAKQAEPWNAVGILDPFLFEPMKKGSRCWLFLKPGTITSLRHEWSHPAFPLGGQEARAASIVESKRWLENICEEYNIDYTTLIEGAGEQRVCFGSEAGQEAFGYGHEGEQALFWHHMEIVTGRRFDMNHRRGTMFVCAC